VDRWGVCALSESVDDPLLWAHYSGGHQGYCVELALSGHALERDNSHLLPHRVQYSDRRLEARTSEWLRLMSGRAGVGSVLEMLAHKDQRWKYEREWRLIAQPSAQSRSIPPAAMTAVILGDRCSESDERTLRAWADKRPRPLEFRRARASPSDYKLIIEPA